MLSGVKNGHVISVRLCKDSLAMHVNHSLKAWALLSSFFSVSAYEKSEVVGPDSSSPGI